MERVMFYNTVSEICWRNSTTGSPKLQSDAAGPQRM